MWQRDPNVSYPLIWQKFQVKTKNFQIQDATEDMTPAILDLMVRYFLPEEPVAQCFTDFVQPESESFHIINEFYKSLIRNRTVLVCMEVDNGEPRVVGCNMTFVAQPDDDFSDLPKTKSISQYISVFFYVSKLCNIFEKFNVPLILKAAGLVVHPAYRGYGIGAEILKARLQFCKAFNIPLTATEFSSAGGQSAARKAGFTLIYEMKYLDILKDIPDLPIEDVKHPIVQYMYKKVET